MATFRLLAGQIPPAPSTPLARFSWP